MAEGDPEIGQADTLIACPECDALHREMPVAADQVARCRRCGTVLAAPRDGAMTRITMLAAAALVLMVAAVSFPFLELSTLGLHQNSSVIDAILAFSGGLMAPLSLAVAFLIVLFNTNIISMPYWFYTGKDSRS